MNQIKKAAQYELRKILEVEKDVWPFEMQASLCDLKKKLELFPHGFFVVYFKGKIVGFTNSQIVNFDYDKPPISWEEATDNGSIINSHKPYGNALYVVSLGILQNFRNQGIGTKLLEKQKMLAKKLGLDYLILNSRVPEYDSYCKLNGEIKIKDYIKKIREEDGLPLDIELRFYKKSGLLIHSLSSMKNDNESREFGVIMIWKSQYYGSP